MMHQASVGYRDRADAGSTLAAELMKYAGQNVAVFGVGAGGVAVAAPIAKALGADLDVLAVRRLALPGQPEHVWGAVAVLGDCVQIAMEPDTDRNGPAAPELCDAVRQRDLTQLRHLEDTYRAGRPPERVNGRLVIVVGDGLSSLAVIRAAASAVRRHHPASLVIALPTATTQMCRQLDRVADEVIYGVCGGLLSHADASVYCDHVSIDIEDVKRLLSA